MANKKSTKPKLADVYRLHPVHRCTSLFLNNIGGLRTSAREILPLLQQLADESNEKFDDFIANSDIEKLEKDGFETLQVPFHNDMEFRKHRRKIQLNSSALFQTPRAIFVAMVSNFDAFMGNLLRELMLLQPGLVSASNKQIVFSDLFNFDSMDEAREALIDEEIDEVLRDGHSKQFEWIKKRFNIDVVKQLSDWPNFFELTQRRHLFVHCDGIVSKQYTQECAKHPSQNSKNDIGDRLHVDPDYFANAYKCVHSTAVEVSQLLWRQIQPKQLKPCDDSLNSICFDMLHHDDFDLAFSLLEFASRTIKKHSDGLHRRILVINFAIAAKFGSSKSHSKILKSEDWSDAGEHFKLAVHVLNDEFDQAAEKMKQIGSANESIGQHEYDSWPLFREFRYSDQFQAAYKEVFGEGFSVQTTADADSEPDAKNAT